MPTVSFNIEYGKNDGLVLSPSNLLNLYMPGIPMCYPNGGRISQNLIRQKILSAQKSLENMLSIKLNKQIIEEEQDYNKQEFTSWGYIRTIYPINAPKQLEGRINNITQITYPASWLSVKDVNDGSHFRNLHVVPNTQGGIEQNQYSVVYSGIAPTIGYFGSNDIPNYWRITYCTGWDADKLPYDLLDAIGKLAAMQVLSITGDLIFGAGIGNQSISIDGVSQTYSTTKGAGKGAFSGRIEQYKTELEQSLKDLKSEYLGLMFRVV